MMRFLLIDAHYYLYRSFHAIRNLYDAQGAPTNAIYGFVQAVRRMITHLQPDLGAIIWDEGLSARRVAIQPSYKQHREAMPQSLQRQELLLKELCPHLGFASLSIPQVEADDLLASYTETAVNAGIEVCIATRDKDLFQLVRPGVYIYTTNKADLTDKSFTLFGEEIIHKKFGIPPHLLVDVLSLTGDAVDNIPGIDGVGPKTAVYLVQLYGGVLALLENLQQIESEKLREKLEKNRIKILKNLDMIRLDPRIPLPCPLEKLHIQPNHDELIRRLEKYGFKFLLRAVKREGGVYC